MDQLPSLMDDPQDSFHPGLPMQTSPQPMQMSPHQQNTMPVQHHSPIQQHSISPHPQTPSPQPPQVQVCTQSQLEGLR